MVAPLRLPVFACRHTCRMVSPILLGSGLAPIRENLALRAASCSGWCGHGGRDPGFAHVPRIRARSTSCSGQPEDKTSKPDPKDTECNDPKRRRAQTTVACPIMLVRSCAATPLGVERARLTRGRLQHAQLACRDAYSMSANRDVDASSDSACSSAWGKVYDRALRLTK